MKDTGLGTKHLTADQKQAILEEYARNLDVAGTAKAVGVSRAQVRLLLKRNGIQLSNCRGGRCHERIDDVRAWASQGLSLCEMARRLGIVNHHRVDDFLKKHGIPRVPFRQTMENNPAWKGGRRVDKDGYVLVKRSDHPNADRHGYVREHRLVMEAILGRHLTIDEVVRHKDDDKQNNDPDNLELYGSNADHLAETLRGQVPEWTPEGRAATLAAVRRPGRKRRATNPAASIRDGQELPGTNDPMPT